jgi:hypothetical protein
MADLVAVVEVGRPATDTEVQSMRTQNVHQSAHCCRICVAVHHVKNRSLAVFNACLSS